MCQFKTMPEEGKESEEYAVDKDVVGVGNISLTLEMILNSGEITCCRKRLRKQ